MEIPAKCAKNANKLKALRSILLFLPLSPRRATPKSENCSEKRGAALSAVKFINASSKGKTPKSLVVKNCQACHMQME